MQRDRERVAAILGVPVEDLQVPDDLIPDILRGQPKPKKKAPDQGRKRARLAVKREPLPPGMPDSDSVAGRDPPLRSVACTSCPPPSPTPFRFSGVRMNPHELTGCLRQRSQRQASQTGGWPWLRRVQLSPGTRARHVRRGLVQRQHVRWHPPAGSASARTSASLYVGPHGWCCPGHAC